MHIDQIIANLAEYNAATPRPAKKQPKPKAPAVTVVQAAPAKTNGHIQPSADEWLKFSILRLVAAVGLAEQPDIVERFVTVIKDHEAPESYQVVN